MDSTSGSFEEVASFFRVGIRTVHEWKSSSPPVIGFWQFGRNVTFHEEAVVELKVKRSVHARAMKPGEAHEIARREWREHLKLCRTDLIGAELADLRRRVQALEKASMEGSSLKGRQHMEVAA